MWFRPAWNSPKAVLALAVWTVALAPSPPFLGEAAGPRSIDRPPEIARARLETRRIRIVPKRYGSWSACDSLEAADLKIRLRGEPVLDPASIRLRRERKPANHALILDTSGSMVGKIRFVRQAAQEYIREIPSGDRAMLLRFDDDVTLVHPLTRRTEQLAEEVAKIRLAGNTALLDGVVRGMEELSLLPERPVLVVLTDGADIGSLYQEDDLFRLLAARPDTAVFTIGFAMPDVADVGHARSAKRLLERLAYRSGGKFFDVPVGSKVSGVYAQVRRLLRSEAVLTVVDPEPDLQPGKLTIRSGVESCRVEPLPNRTPDMEADLRRPAERYGRFQPKGYEPRCERWEETPAAVLPGNGGFHLCFLDVIMETGSLYDPWGNLPYGINWFLSLDVRPAWVPVPSFDRLPTRPVELMEGLGREALQAALRGPPPGDPRMTPVEDYGRPFSDYESMVDGNRLLEIRPFIVEQLALEPSYRAWAEERWREDGRRWMARQVDRLRAFSPGLPETVLERMAEGSPEGKAILKRMKNPSFADLQPYLGAWLGEIPASDLFREWEMEQMNRLLAGEPDDRFVEEWRELWKVFRAPSYARVLGLTGPVRDLEQDRIGFWRVVLPREAWIQMRVKGLKRHPDWNDLPMDLLPPRPFAYEELSRKLQGRQGGGDLADYRVLSLKYELTGKPYRRTPARGWESARYALTLRRDRDGAERSIEGTIPPDRSN